MARVRWVVPVLLLVFTSAVLAAPRKAATRPPRQLHKVGDHWTPYNPRIPQRFPTQKVQYRWATRCGTGNTYYGNAYSAPAVGVQTYITALTGLPGDPRPWKGGLDGNVPRNGRGQRDTASMEREVPGRNGRRHDRRDARSAPFPLGSEADIAVGIPLTYDDRCPIRPSFEDVETNTLHDQTRHWRRDGRPRYQRGVRAPGVLPRDYLVVKRDELIRPRKLIKSDVITITAGRSNLCATEDRHRPVTRCRDIHLDDGSSHACPSHPLSRLTE